MNDRINPDKAIDALGKLDPEFICNMAQYIKEIEDKLNLTTKEKKAAIKKQKFELAVRDEKNNYNHN